jgi:hypothetical protein
MPNWVGVSKAGGQAVEYNMHIYIVGASKATAHFFGLICLFSPFSFFGATGLLKTLKSSKSPEINSPGAQLHLRPNARFNMHVTCSSVVALYTVLLAISTTATPLNSDTSPSSVLQKRAHGTCDGDPRCQAWMGANFKDLVSRTFRDGVNYNRRMSIPSLRIQELKFGASFS